MASAVTDSHDWGKVYENVQAMAQIPGTSCRKDIGSQFVFRDMLVKLDDVLDSVTKASSPPVMVFVYADVVRLPTERNWAFNNVALFIAARRIDATTGTFFQLDYRGDNNKATFVAYATEIQGPLKVRVFTSPDPKHEPMIYDLSQFDSLGVQITYQDGAPVRKDLTHIDDKALELGKDLWMSMSSIFQFATVLFEAQPEVTGAMLRWIKAITAPSKIARDLYLQSSALLSQLTLSTNRVSFVPYLSQKIYEDIALGFQNAAVQYEEQYKIFSHEKKDKKRWIAAAEQMQRYFEATGDFNQQLINQTKENLNNAQQAVDEATRQFNWQKLKAETAAIAFTIDVEKWKQDQILKSVFSICMALVEFAGAIALMAGGEETAGASAGKAAAEAGKAADEAVKAGGTVANMLRSMKDLAKSMAELKKVGEALLKVFTFINKLYKEVQKIGSASRFDDLTMPLEDDISCQAEWDVFRIDVDKMLNSVIKEGIGSAEEYKAELEKLAVYGKALSAAQSSFIQVAQELVRLYMQKHVSDTMNDSLNSYIQKLEEDVKPDEVMMQLLYVRMLNIKRWMYIAILNYTRAYRYWALRDSVVSPSIVKSVQELQEDLARIKRDYADALGSFNPPPQSFGMEGKGKVFMVTDEAILAKFRMNKEAQIIVPLEIDAFKGWDRVRLTRIRVWLDGVTGSKVYVKIANSGTYNDRFKGVLYRFTSAPLDRRFEYSARHGHRRKIQVDGSVADEERYAYFQPTPFSEWFISLPKELNQDVDVEGLTKITMEFAGSVIGSKALSVLNSLDIAGSVKPARVNRITSKRQINGSTTSGLYNDGKSEIN